MMKDPKSARVEMFIWVGEFRRWFTAQQENAAANVTQKGKEV